MVGLIHWYPVGAAPVAVAIQIRAVETSANQNGSVPSAATSTNDRPNPSPYQFTGGSPTYAATTCPLATIRQITANLPLIASVSGATGGGFLSIRQDTSGTSSRVGGVFNTATLPAGTFNNPFNSLSGVTINC